MKKFINVMATTAMVASVVAPMAASAAASYTVGSVKVVKSGNQDLGSVKVSVPQLEVKAGDFVVLRLPSDFDYNLTVGETYSLSQVAATDEYELDPTTAGAPNTDNVSIRIPALDNAFNGGDAGITVQAISENELRINVGTTAIVDATEKDGYFYVNLKKVKVDTSAPATINLAIEGRSGSAFVGGTVAIAQYGTGLTNVTVDSVKTITTSKTAIDVIRLKEDRPGAFENGKKIKLKLPVGFKWDDSAEGFSFFDVQGGYSAPTVATEDDGRTLVLTSTHTSNSTASYVLLKDLGVVVDDETVAKLGEVTVSVSGDASVVMSNQAVAKYGDYSTSVEGYGDVKEVNAGAIEEEIGAFQIKEGIAASLGANKTITATLVGGAKFTKLPSLDNVNSKNTGETIINGRTWTPIGSNGETIRLSLGNTASAKAVKAIFEKAEIAVSPEAEGDIKLVFSGSAGITGEIVVAKAVKPVNASVNAPATVKIGETVKLPTISVFENKKEAISSKGTTLKSNVAYDSTTGLYYIDVDNSTTFNAGDVVVPSSEAFTTGQNELRLLFPAGVVPTLPTAVNVVEGDLLLNKDSVRVATTNDGRWYIGVTVRATSAVPSKVDFEGVTVSVDRTVPTGALDVKVQGASVIQSGAYFPGFTSIASAKVADVVTPASNQTSGDASFVIDSTSYTVNGVEKTADVAPFIENGRTYLPIRFVAEATGVSEDNIIWNDAARTVTLIKGDRVAQVKIGSKDLTVNGVVIPMDVAAKIKDGRTVLPLRFLAQALGADVQWDEATRTVKIK